MLVRAQSIRRVLLAATSLVTLSVAAASAEDFDASRLPRLPDAKIVFSGAPVTNYTVPGKVADAADAVNRLMLAEHWQPFIAPFSSNPKLPDFMVTRFKKDGIAVEVDVSVAPAMSNATFVSYTGLINENDLPFPGDATDIQFDSTRPYLACVTSAGIDDTLKLFTNELAARGWSARPENARSDRKSDKGAYAIFTRSENRGLFLTLMRGDDARLKVEIRAISADAIGARPEDIATVAPPPQSPAERAEAEAAKNRARMDQAKRDAAQADADAIVAKAQQVARDTVAQAMKDAQGIRASAAPTAKAQPATDSSAPVKVAANNALPIPVPEGAEDVDYVAEDGTLEFNSSQSVKALATFYRTALKAQGWKEDTDQINKPNMVTLDFAKDGKELSFTIMKLGNSTNVSVDGSALKTAAARSDSADDKGASMSDVQVSAKDLEPEAEDMGGFPVPKQHTMSEGGKSQFRRDLNASITADVPAVLDFYRRELTKRGWKEQADGAVIKPDQALVTFASNEGTALLKLGRKDGQTMVNLATRDQAAAAKAGVLPKPGQVKLLFGNISPADATVTINGKPIKVAAGVGVKAPSGPSLELPPGHYKYSIKLAGKPAQSDEIDLGADQAWGMMVGPGGLLPLQVY